MLKSKNGTHKLLGICTAGIHRENVTDLVSAIVRSASAHGMKVLIFNAFTDMYKHNDFAKGEAGIYDLIGSRLLDALVVMPETIKNDDVTNDIIGFANRIGLPVISVDRRIEGCTNVLFNYADSFEEIIRHVVAHHGCRRINFIAGIKGNSFSEERVERFRKVLAEYSIPFDERRLGYGDFWEGPTKVLCESYFESDLPFPEAIICANDSMALTACRVMQEHGLKVPNDVIITGFDGIELEKYNTPRLTTCAVDISEAGLAVAEAAAKLISGSETIPDTHIPYRMRISQSCGCAPINMSVIADKILELNRSIIRNDEHETYMLTYLTRALSCTKVPRLADVMRHYSDTQTWCCTNSDFTADKHIKHKGSFTDRMTLFMTTEQEQSKVKSFPTDQLLPGLGEILDKYDSLMFCPLHYEDKMIGYIVFNVMIGSVSFTNKRRFVLLSDQMLESFKNRLTIQHANEKLADMHIHDPMTGLLNRRGFYKQAARLMRRLAKQHGAAVIFSVDMDNLKGINDTYGHDDGDKALKALSAALLRCTGKNDICSRFGGDEFIIMSGSSEPDFTDSFEYRLRDVLSEFPKRARVNYSIDVSIGAFSGRFSTAEGLDECIRLADERMYEQKRSHKRSEPR